MSGAFYEDGPDVPVPRLILWKLATRSQRLLAWQALDASPVMIERERALLDEALADLRAVLSERGLEWSANDELQ